MGKHTKGWLIAAAVLVFVGCIVFWGVMTALNWDFSKISTGQLETNTYSINEDFKSISVKSNTADVVFAATQDENASVICFEEANLKHTVSVKDGTLVIELIDSRKWNDHIGIVSRTPTITVNLPKTQYDMLTIREETGDVEIAKEFTFEGLDISLSTGDVKNYASASSTKIKTTTGDIHTENISADTLELSVSTGDVTVRSVACAGSAKISVSSGDATLADMVCNELLSTGNTGDIRLENVTAAESFTIKRTTGDVKFQSCDAGALMIETDTGDVAGSLLSEKIFIIETNTGDVEIPSSTTGGICEINTSTGDIKITIG